MGWLPGQGLGAQGQVRAGDAEGTQRRKHSDSHFELNRQAIGCIKFSTSAFAILLLAGHCGARHRWWAGQPRAASGPAWCWIRAHVHGGRETSSQRILKILRCLHGECRGVFG